MYFCIDATGDSQMEVPHLLLMEDEQTGGVIATVVLICNSVYST